MRHVTTAGRLAALGFCLTWGATVTAAPQDDPIQPHPAAIEDLAPQSIMIDMAKAGSTVVAVGERGHILLSDDGSNWRQVASPISALLTRVSFVNDTVGYAGGHDAAILKTLDGGQTWVLKNYQPDLEQAIYDLHFFDADNGIAVGAYDLFWRTGDGGDTWERIDSPVGQGELHHYSITALKDGTLLIAGERGMLSRSLDSGLTWERIVSPYFGSYFGAVASGPTGAIVYGLRGNTYVLPDVASLPTVEPDEYGEYPLGEMPEGGAIEIKAPSTDSLFNGIATRGGGALLVGVNGTVLRYTPGRSELARVPSGTSAPLGDVEAIGNTLVLAGESGLNTINGN